MSIEEPPTGGPPSTARAGSTAADPVVFRMSPLAVLAVLVFAVCLTPIAGLGPGWPWVYLIPLLMIVWLLLTRTTADAEAVTVQRLIGRRRVAWGDITALRLGRSRNPATARVSVVLRDGTEIGLPAVHVRDLPRLAAVSGGRLADPAGGSPAT